MLEQKPEPTLRPNQVIKHPPLESFSAYAPEATDQTLSPLASVLNAAPAEAKVNFYSLRLQDLTQTLQGMGKEKFRAQQLYKWIYEKRVVDFEQMSNVAKDFRRELDSIFSLQMPRVTQHLRSVDGTQKFLFRLHDGYTVEAVLIPSEGRYSLCVSSEVGCNMACAFCFTGKQKLKRRLTADEIVSQFILVEDRLNEDLKNGVARPADLSFDVPDHVTNVVFMGMGEPLDNPDEVFKAIEILHEPFGRNFSRRKFTVSTSGLVPVMHRIADSKARLAVSLNGYDNESRSKLMPINRKYPLEMLLEECRQYARQTGDRVTFEYVLLKGITDQVEHARKVWAMVKSVPCKVNIIPFNEHPGSGFERPSDEQVAIFHAELMRLGCHVLLRRTMGRDIFAACGQLTSEFENKPERMDISNSRIGGKKRV